MLPTYNTPFILPTTLKHFERVMTNTWCPSIKQLSIYHVRVLPGTKEDCEKAALELSFSQDTSDMQHALSPAFRGKDSH